MRYNRLKDIGLSEDDIKKNLMFTTDKVGDVMQAHMSPADGKKWFGAAPPDLTLIARSRGADYIYSYLRGFYKDPTRPTGWNNLVFDKVGMPHVLWEQQGVRAVKLDANGKPVLDEHGKPVLVWERRLRRYHRIRRICARFDQLYVVYGRTCASSAQANRLCRFNVLVGGIAAVGLLPEKRILERRTLIL